MKRKRGEHGKLTTQKERVEELMAMEEDVLLRHVAKRHLVMCARLMDKAEDASGRDLANYVKATNHLVKQRSEHSGGVEIGIAEAGGAIRKVFGWGNPAVPAAVPDAVVNGSEPFPGVQQSSPSGADNGNSPGGGT